MDDCIFCKIASGQAPASVVFESDSVIAFEAAPGVTSGHMLVIPKQHFESVLDVDPDIFKEVMSVVQTLSQKKVGKDGVTAVNILNASGKDAQQSIFHLHVHIIPRRKDDGLDMWIREGL